MEVDYQKGDYQWQDQKTEEVADKERQGVAVEALTPAGAARVDLGGVPVVERAEEQAAKDKRCKIEER